MKIRVKGEGYNFRFWVPLLPSILSLGLKIGRHYSPEVPDAKFIVPIVKELKKWRKKHGKLTLVEVDSKDVKVHIDL